MRGYPTTFARINDTDDVDLRALLMAAANVPVPGRYDNEGWLGFRKLMERVAALCMLESARTVRVSSIKPSTTDGTMIIIFRVGGNMVEVQWKRQRVTVMRGAGGLLTTTVTHYELPNEIVKFKGE